MTLAAAGIAVGLALSFAGTRLVGNLLFGVTTRDPWIVAGIPLLLALAALVASAQPAWRAARVDPTVALRIE
jgi:ABC-type antimicrobial peptide transport system permease subunit